MFEKVVQNYNDEASLVSLIENVYCSQTGYMFPNNRAEHILLSRSGNVSRFTLMLPDRD